MALAGKTAIITGSNSGIGLGIAEVLVREGAHVILNSFTDREEDHALAAKIADGQPGSAEYRQADMSDGDACRALVDGVAKDRGTVDILINNAGIQHVAAIEEFPQDSWNRIIAINMNSAYHTTARAVPVMRENGWGRIINVASVHGLRASPFKSAYVAAKHGVVGMSKVVALETAEDPITCNAICPGYVLTPLVEAQIPDTMEKYGMDRDTVVREVMLQRQPSREFATTEQIGGTAAFLCSDAAAQITGTTISVDGGWSAM
ncbi:3-hydroxybutyrate dehydrogenase [Oceanomicrobium pacificus]|uniref:3-hydroxybutyrate dehydrogenase n=1 Tax=Oceanomicrobium pacificus TaxID=2692916 RepID=A0A6B0TVP4_9RHOB|nr:3-hydroxybutyrate dehydrogenase [Oceanomicrobium pacificus]MXU65845.1 3-hydroxybutyrate dehydrogenase [Oceanomicrobium pacificus]